LFFKTQDIVATLGDVKHGDKIPLQLTGNLSEEYGGHEFVAEDVITIIERGKKKRR
jgi:hypothetical protein